MKIASRGFFGGILLSCGIGVATQDDRGYIVVVAITFAVVGGMLYSNAVDDEIAQRRKPDA